ncbi:MAG: hypothetical protein WBW80_13705 [Acidimicrobiales bacterium]
MTDQRQPDDHLYAAELSDLAVGVLDGRERAAVLDHVASCATCTAELNELTAAADSLVHLAPEVDPPVGFETRVFDRIPARPVITPLRRGWHRSFVVSVAAAVVALAFGIGWVVHSSSPSPTRNATATPGGYVAEAALVSPDGRSSGTVFVYPGASPWLFMTVSSSPWTGRLRCTITSTDGTTRTIGTFPVVAGRPSSWGAPLPVAAGSVRTAELIGPNGHVLASARLQ